MFSKFVKVKSTSKFDDCIVGLFLCDVNSRDANNKTLDVIIKSLKVPGVFTKVTIFSFLTFTPYPICYTFF